MEVLRMITKNVKEKIAERGLFDFIASDYWKLSKDEIVTLFKEFIYAVYAIDNDICRQAEEDMWDEIEIDEELED